MASRKAPRNRRLKTREVDDEPSLAHASTALASVAPPPHHDDEPKGQRWVRFKQAVWTALRAVAVVVAIAGAIAVGRLVRNYLHTSESFAVTAIHVEGNARIEEASLIETAELAVGDNVFDDPPHEVERRLRDHPWIAAARVERRLPGTFSIEIEERHPAACLMLDDELYLIGDDATLFKSHELGDPIDLPVVTGVERDRFISDRAYRTSLLIETVALMHDYRMAGLWRREPIGEIHVGRADDVTLYVGEDGMEVRLGRGPFLTKLRRLRRVLDRLGDERALYVYLDNVRRPDRVTVRLRETPAPPEEGPEEAQRADSTSPAAQTAPPADPAG